MFDNQEENAWNSTHAIQNLMTHEKYRITDRRLK